MRACVRACVCVCRGGARLLVCACACACVCVCVCVCVCAHARAMTAQGMCHGAKYTYTHIHANHYTKTHVAIKDSIRVKHHRQIDTKQNPHSHACIERLVIA